jgi:ribonucleoside-triphosphate reductase
MQRVIKRDGREVEFDKTKIIKSIDKSFAALGKEDVDGVAEKIADSIEALDKILDVDEIQNLIEAKLMASKHKDVAKTYINYRYLHKMARGQYNELMTAVAEKLTAKNVQNQNANVDEASFGGRVGEASSVVTKQYALEYLVSPMAKANHQNNEVYIHDLDAYATGSHNCMSIPFDDLLKNGFNTRQTDVRPAQSINTAFQLLAVIFQLQSLQQFGGVSATHLDWTMTPYVRKSFYKHYKNVCDVIPGIPDNLYLEAPEEVSIDDPIYRGQHWWNFVKRYITLKAVKATKKELKQAVEGMYHNLNTLQSRSGNQLPFTSINYGTCTLPEGRMVIRALLEGSIKGIGALHKTSIFPFGIFQCMTGVNRKKGDPNYDLFRLALKSTSKRLYPNYCNVDWSGNAGYDREDPRTYFSTMGKRKLQLI